MAPRAAQPVITLLTDFGDQDGFVGAMRGVIVSRTPSCRLIDLAHGVPPGDVAKAARVLARAAPLFPRGTIHLVVVDPGVGSERRAIVAEAGGHQFVAPDNGVLTLALAALGGAEVLRVARDETLWRSPVGSTFHGRDVFAPLAAAIAGGVPLDEIGPTVDDVVRLEWPEPEHTEHIWRGHVVEVDHFGNLITNLPWPGSVSTTTRVDVAVDDASVASGPVESYSAVEPGAVALVVGSEGTLEVAVRDGDAARLLGAGVGSVVICHLSR